MSKKKTTPTKKPGNGSKASAPKKALAAGGSPMNVDLLQQIVQLMNDSGLNTVEIRDGDKRVMLSRGAPAGSAPVYAAAPSYAPQAPAAAPSAQPSASSATSSAADSDAGLVSIKSPMVGTFYGRANPESKPFVAVGSTIDDDTDVCIIEAMKVFNNIKAETRGTIAKILVADGQTVEFGQPLFLVKP